MTRAGTRIFDAATAEKIASLTSTAAEHGLAWSLDFLGASVCADGPVFTTQLFDRDDRVVVVGRGRTLAEAITVLHEKWRARGLPVEDL